MINLRDILNESIVGSNNVGHPAYRFSWYKDDDIVTILVIYKNSDAWPDWDKAKVKEEYDKLESVYKKDIRYTFNRLSKSKDKILTYLLCIVLSCKNPEEISEKLDRLIKNDNIRIDSQRLGSLSGSRNIRIGFKHKNHPSLISTLSFFKHSANEYSNYKYVK